MTVSDDARVVDALVMDGARIDGGARVVNAIVGPGEVVAPDAVVEDRMQAGGQAAIR